MKQIIKCNKENNYEEINNIVEKNMQIKNLQFLSEDFNLIIDYLLDYLGSKDQQSNLKKIFPEDNFYYLRNYEDVDNPKGIMIIIDNNQFKKFINWEFELFKKKKFIDKLGYPIVNSNILNYFLNLKKLDYKIIKKVILLFLNLVYNYLDDFILNILFCGLYNLCNFLEQKKSTIDIDNFLNVIIDTNYLKNLRNKIDDFTLKEIKNEFYKLIKFNNEFYNTNQSFKNIFKFSNIEGIFIIFLCKFKLISDNF